MSRWSLLFSYRNHDLELQWLAECLMRVRPWINDVYPPPI